VSEALLLDTHVVIWWALGRDQLSDRASDAIRSIANKVFFSPVTAMEIVTKVRIGKLDFARPLASGFADQMVRHGFAELPLTAADAEMAGSFISTNNDPWDRLLAAQARLHGLALVTSDGRMSDFGVTIIW